MGFGEPSTIFRNVDVYSSPSPPILNLSGVSLDVPCWGLSWSGWARGQCAQLLPRIGTGLGDEFCNLLSFPRVLKFSRTWTCLYLCLKMMFPAAGCPSAIPEGIREGVWLLANSLVNWTVRLSTHALDPAAGVHSRMLTLTVTEPWTFTAPLYASVSSSIQ